MNGKDILKQIGHCEKVIRLLEEELLSFEKSYRKTKSENVKIKILEIKCKIDEEITNQAIIKIRGYEIIRSLSDPIEKWIMIYHFICLLSLEETASRLNYSERQTVRIYNNACKKINAQYKWPTHNI